jgi:hypothetical protein
MAKLTAWLVTILGVVLALSALKVTVLVPYQDYIMAIGVLAIGIGKLVRNYSGKKK